MPYVRHIESTVNIALAMRINRNPHCSHAINETLIIFFSRADSIVQAAGMQNFKDNLVAWLWCTAAVAATQNVCSEVNHQRR
jgi:hypothetical protein